MTYKVFLSYSTKDILIVRKVRKFLRLPNVELFVAEYSVNPGRSLPNAIIKAINDCDLFVLLWSPNSQYSEWVPQEIGIAKGNNKKILPLILKEGMRLPGFIKELKYLPLFKSPEKSISWLRKHIFSKAQNKLSKEQKNRNLILMGIGIALIWLIGGSNEYDT